MFEQPIALPSQGVSGSILLVEHWTSMKGSKLAEGERRLLLMMLEGAPLCYQGNMKPRNPRQRSIFTEARDWFYPKRDARHPRFSFHSVSDLLGIEGEGLRRRRIFSISASCRGFANGRPIGGSSSGVGLGSSNTAGFAPRKRPSLTEGRPGRVTSENNYGINESDSLKAGGCARGLCGGLRTLQRRTKERC